MVEDTNAGGSGESRRQPTVEDAKYMSVDQLTELGRFGLRVIAQELGLCEDPIFKVAFHGMSSGEQAQHLHGVLQERSNAEATNLVGYTSSTEIAARVLRAEYLMRRALADNAELGKHIMNLDGRLIEVRRFLRHEEQAHATCRSALRKLKSRLTPAMLAHVKKLDTLSRQKKTKSARKNTKKL